MGTRQVLAPRGLNGLADANKHDMSGQSEFDSHGIDPVQHPPEFSSHGIGSKCPCFDPLFASSSSSQRPLSLQKGDMLDDCS